MFYCIPSPPQNGERNSDLDEWCIVELQGDLDVRGDRIMSGQFIGDLLYNKYGQPILIIGHHILQGRLQKIDKPLLVVEKCDLKRRDATDEDETMLDISQLPVTQSQEQQQQQDLDSTAHSIASNRTVLDTTVAIEHKVLPKVEYRVRAVVRNKVLFKARPKPIIANVSKTV
ncbi:chromosome transmission fidelity protein 8 homolog [Anopheles maculipalpis]|uniref:chromosome transmission fidelity protein 8 homolog n=1 Tax=Anopheles maculipalpis TaxID=1496333 RepID=UPI002158E363|nr:chromosome transmission fidelity protein 8 homolog [Anopheles maculipalpis]